MSLVLKLVGDEGALGLIQGVSGALTAVLVYVLGRMARPQDRLKIFVGGLIVFFVGTLFNGILFSATGVILFVSLGFSNLPFHSVMQAITVMTTAAIVTTQ